MQSWFRKRTGSASLHTAGRARCPFGLTIKYVLELLLLGTSPNGGQRNAVAGIAICQEQRGIAVVEVIRPYHHRNGKVL